MSRKKRKAKVKSKKEKKVESHESEVLSQSVDSEDVVLKTGNEKKTDSALSTHHSGLALAFGLRNHHRDRHFFAFFLARAKTVSS